MKLHLDTGLIESARYLPSPNCDDREQCNGQALAKTADKGRLGEPYSDRSDGIEAVIVHSISLPPGEYGGDAVSKFFTNKLDPNQHPYFADICHLQVSAHFFISRDGELLQFVPTHKRAWHAGESVCLGKPKANNFTIGVELEGLDIGTDGYSVHQYSMLSELCDCLTRAYPSIAAHNIFAHSDIAPGRKLDPGRYFDWQKFQQRLLELAHKGVPD
jgi:AmpD protein